MNEFSKTKQKLEECHLKLDNIFGILETLVMELDAYKDDKKMVIKIISQFCTLIDFGEQEVVALEQIILKLRCAGEQNSQ